MILHNSLCCQQPVERGLSGNLFLEINSKGHKETVISLRAGQLYPFWRSVHTSDSWSGPLTCTGRLGTRQVIPNPTKRMFVRMKARKALVTFWVFLSLHFFFISPLVVKIRKRDTVIIHWYHDSKVHFLVSFITLVNKQDSNVWAQTWKGVKETTQTWLTCCRVPFHPLRHHSPSASSPWSDQSQEWSSGKAAAACRRWRSTDSLRDGSECWGKMLRKNEKGKGQNEGQKHGGFRTFSTWLMTMTVQLIISPGQ